MKLLWLHAVVSVSPLFSIKMYHSHDYIKCYA